MRSNTSSAPARRTRRQVARRTRRRPLLIASALAFAVLATAGITATTPMSTSASASTAQAAGYFGAFELASFTTPTPKIAAEPALATDDTTDARAALDTAAATVTDAQTVAADIAASGLDIGVPDTTVDTSDLQVAIERLDVANKSATPFVASLTDEVTEQIAVVSERVSGLRGSLDAAIALKAEQEAAEKARQEAEAKAAAAAAAAAQATKTKSPGSPSPAPAYAAGGTSAGDAQAIARGMLGNYGWGDDQFGCLVSLWNKESGWNYQAYNRSSGAYGIPQALPGSKMASAGADWQTNAGTQIAWGLGYISGRYGSPCGAWSHSQSTGWY